MNLKPDNGDFGNGVDLLINGKQRGRQRGHRYAANRGDTAMRLDRGVTAIRLTEGDTAMRLDRGGDRGVTAMRLTEGIPLCGWTEGSPLYG